MSESNVKQLIRAYRHPFEYISPRLYSLNDDELFVIQGKGDESNLFIADDNEYQ
jgi:hypothetical protein